MKYYFKIFLLFTLFYTQLTLAQEIKSKDMYIEYISYPKRVFTGQKFELKLKATILHTEDKFDKIITTFNGSKNIELPNKEPLWIQDKEFVYSSNIVFKSKDTQFLLPHLTLALFKDNRIIDFISIKPPKIKFEKIAVNEKLFSHVIAAKLNVHSALTKQYNNNMLLVTLNIEAFSSNLEDMNLISYKDQGIKSLTDNQPRQNMYYYVMVPIHTKELQFTYYNTTIRDFEMITLPISLEEELVSTQTDLNPYNSSILIYKQTSIFTLLFITLFIYIFKRDNIYLIFSTIWIIIIVYLFIPNQKIILQPNKQVFILPTQSSTTYKITTHEEVVEVINTKDNYIKILFQNHNIGWIKNDQ